MASRRVTRPPDESTATRHAPRDHTQQSRNAARRIRRKLILLHTAFTLALAAILLPVAGIVVDRLVLRAEQREARTALELLLGSTDELHEETRSPGNLRLSIGTADDLRLPPEAIARANAASPGSAVTLLSPEGLPRAAAVLARAAEQQDDAAPPARFVTLDQLSSDAHETALRAVLLLGAALGAIYAFIALVLETVILPRQVYVPIERLRVADEAVQAGDRDAELIAEADIPRDELGDIMRSRNASIVKLRKQERDLNEALAHLEEIAAELKQKNDLIETARRNLADQERLAGLGMMSAGIAHEINTPLAVLKGSVQQLAESSDRPDPQRIALMQRVIGRLERLSESLLDFARVREPNRETLPIAPLLDEAWQLVRIDRRPEHVVFDNDVPSSARAPIDADRLTQVFVNLLRNAVDATGRGRIAATAEQISRLGTRYLAVRIADDGPGIDPKVFPRLFEPFASTKLDARGTGLGLAVSEGIVKEHGGVLTARNNAAAEGNKAGATFEILLPIDPIDPADTPPGTATQDAR
jgi:signal transduction histidine kinase